MQINFKRKILENRMTTEIWTENFWKEFLIFVEGISGSGMDSVP